MRQCLLVLFVVCVAAPSLTADVHPVLLDANVSAAKCIECHEDKTKGKSVHAALKTGCLSCHEVRVSRNVTRVKLITPTVANLCFTCHKDKNPATLTGKIHPPNVRDCLKCHDPHHSENPALLLKPTAGDASQNLCLSCHDEGVHVAKGGSRHPALDSGCDACHVIHKTGDASQAEFRYHLSKPAPQLCVDCHDVKDAALVKAHQNQPFAAADCTECHAPHESKSPKLMQAFLHDPFAGKQCDSCHQPAKDGKVVLTQKDVKSICVTCHEDEAKQIASAKVQHPGAQGDCTDCHNPHAGRSPEFLQPDPVAACLTCHPDQAAEFKKKHLHQPAFEQGCATCHEAHGNDNAHLLRTKDVNALCLECHGPDANPQKVTDSSLVSIFDGKVLLPGNYFAKVPILPLKYGRGHPTENHPVTGTINPNSKSSTQMNCLTCHQPHASANAALLVKDQEPNMAFCKTCHTEGTMQLR